MSWLLPERVRAAHRGGDLPYRPDIDGLRGLAVLLVVLNHVGFRLLPGGYVGVDVFFVISGYLISGIIVTRREAGRFRFAPFYLRRAQRLLPAMVLMLTVTLVAGWQLLSPAGYSELAKSVLWTLGLAANRFFRDSTSGYFGADAATLPLLHLWSLSVEEQFYLLWPAALLAVLRLRSTLLRALLIGGSVLLSFAWAQAVLKSDPSSAYFMLPARSGEFLTGGLVWMLSRRERPETPLIANLLSAAGLLLLLAAATRYGPATRFPGLAALAPCGGAVLLLAAPRFGPSIVSRALASRPAVGLGLISYSVYLWHWPIIAYLHVAQVPITRLSAALVVAASIVLGLASWVFIERGFRLKLQAGAKPAALTAGLGATLLLAGCVTVLARQGVPERFPFALLTQEQLTAERGRYWKGVDARNTVFAAGDPRLKTLVVGNSHGIDLAYALREAGYPGAVKLVETTHLCLNFGHDPVIPKDTELCQGVLRTVLSSPELRDADVIYLHDHWPRYDEAGLARMLRQIRARTGAPIVVFGPKMTFTEDALTISQQAQSQGRVMMPSINAYSVSSQQTDRRAIDQALKAFLARPPVAKVRYVSSLDVECEPSQICPILGTGGTYLYFDAGHFTLAGARRFGLRLREKVPDLFAAAAPTSSVTATRGRVFD